MAALGGERAYAAPLAGALIFLIYLATHLRLFVEQMFASSDSASYPVLTERFAGHTGPFRQSEPGYYIVDRITAALPGHRIIWELYPVAMAGFTALFCGWAVGRIAGRWAGGFTAAVILAASPETLITYVAQVTHGSTWFGCALLFALGVHLLTRPPLGVWRWLTPVLCLVVALAVGFWAASDPLLVVAGMVPAGLAMFVAPPSQGWWRKRRYPAASMLGTLVIAVLTGVLTSYYYYSQGWTVFPISGLPQPYSFAGAADAVHNIGTLIQATLLVGDANFFGRVISPATGLLLASAVITIVAMTMPYRLYRATSTDTSEPLPRPAALFAGVYWLTSELVLIVAMIVTNVAGDAYAFRYLVPFLLGAACTAPLWARASRGRQLLVAGAGAVFVATGVVQLRALAATDAGPLGYAHPIEQLASFLRDHHLTHGYAPYWDSASSEWILGSGFNIRPVVTDAAGNLYMDSRWAPISAYTYGGSSFVVTDPDVQVMGQWVPGYPTPQPLQVTYGPPTTVYRVDRYTIYVYGYDVGTDIAR